MRKKTIKALPIGFILLSLMMIVGFSPSSQDAAPQPKQSVPGPEIVTIATKTDFPYYIPAPKQAELGVQSATILVNYNPAGCSGTTTPWPTEAQNAFSFATNIWASLLNSSQTIIVNACWRTDLGFGVLGSAGAEDYTRNFSGAPENNTFYPIALANALNNGDLNNNDGFDTDNDGLDTDAEISANFNSTFNWYFGTDGNTPFSQYDFVTVVLHELGHGLGFAGSMFVSGSGVGMWGLAGNPFIYDRFTQDGSGNSLLNQSIYPNVSTALGNALRSGNIFFSGPNANAANGGNRVSLYAPSSWSQGSSYSHLAESFNNTPNDLMTFSISNGTAIHDPGPVVLGMFQDMGWNVITAPDLTLDKQLVGGDHQPGDPVSFTLTVRNTGQTAATSITLEDIIPSEILTPSWSSANGSVTEQPGAAFTWSLPDLDPNESLVITVSGTIDPGLPSDFAIVNRATVSTTDSEATVVNNTGLAIVGGSRIFLPSVLK